MKKAIQLKRNMSIFLDPKPIPLTEQRGIHFIRCLCITFLFYISILHPILTQTFIHVYIDISRIHSINSYHQLKLNNVKRHQGYKGTGPASKEF